MAHPNHIEGGHALMSLYGASSNFVSHMEEHLSNMPKQNPSRGAVARMTNSALDNADMSDALSASAHNDQDYKSAADFLHQGTEEFSKLHEGLIKTHYADHPIVQASKKHLDTRKAGVANYRKTFGLDNDDTDARFNEIVENLNKGQQFKPKDEDGTNA